jgi:DNA-binding response OmpR family regulator/DNA-binding CsgD family transcriptional regulator
MGFRRMADLGYARDRVLLVDDSPEELRMLSETIEAAGMEPLVAPHGAAALLLVQTVTPCLIVLDAVMPGIDGFELCRRLKRDPLVSHVPIVFMTGLADTAHVVEGLQAGAADYVTKPVIMEELLARIRVHMANARRAEGARIGLDATGRHLLALDERGAILWCTPQAASSLQGLFPNSDPGHAAATEDLAKQLRALVTSVVPGAVGRLESLGGRALRAEYLHVDGRTELLFRLAKADEDGEARRLSRAFQLTDREAEVLVWTARGKSNREMSEILNISPRTVNKHLERIFTKLGVENRAAATSVAMSVILAHD